MSPAHVLEPTYRRLKQELLEGTWPGGTKLEAMRLADDFGVSMTPVRDSLNQLVGEGLVGLTPGEGFRVPVLTEQDLRDILAVNMSLLETAVSATWSDASAVEDPVCSDTYPDRLTTAFMTLARGSRNGFLTYLVGRISDRLHPVRKLEPQVLPEALAILDRIEQSARASRREQLDVLRHYHEQCHAIVPRLIHLMSKSS